LLAAWGGPRLNLCGSVSPRESAALIERASCFAGHDSGPMHLSAAVMTPSVAVFSLKNPPGLWFPYGKDNRIFYPGLDWSGGNPPVIRDAAGEIALSSISADVVAEACVDILDAVQ
jgi:heptosyltransferase III